MPETRITYFFLFQSIHEVLKAEGQLKNKGAIFEIVPVPRSLSSDCGVCIAVQELSDSITSLLPLLDPEKCFSFDGNTYCSINAHTLTSSSESPVG